jgi:hypothetical protein
MITLLVNQSELSLLHTSGLNHRGGNGEVRYGMRTNMNHVLVIAAIAIG